MALDGLPAIYSSWETRPRQRVRHLLLVHCDSPSPPAVYDAVYSLVVADEQLHPAYT
jgi:hypothetical protein